MQAFARQLGRQISVRF